MKKVLIGFTAILLILAGCGNEEKNKEKTEEKEVIESDVVNGLTYEILEYETKENIVTEMLHVEGNFVFVRFKVTNISDEMIKLSYYNIELEFDGDLASMDGTNGTIAESDDSGEYMDGEYLTKRVEIEPGDTIELVGVFSSYVYNDIILDSDEYVFIVSDSEIEDKLEIPLKD